MTKSYTVFQIWGFGRTVKLQCDFSAMMSPANFRDFILEPLRNQVARADQVLYHLGAILEVEGIDALRWTSGDAGPDGTLEDFPEMSMEQAATLLDYAEKHWRDVQGLSAIRNDSAATY